MATTTDRKDDAMTIEQTIVYKIGDRVILDGNIPATITNTNVWCGPVRNTYGGDNCHGVSVRPDDGYSDSGYSTRSRAVALYRVRPVEEVAS
jgi:hypothetical protein